MEGNPFDDFIRRKYNHDGTWEGIPNPDQGMRAIGVLQQLSTGTASKTDIIGLIAGAGLGLFIAGKFPKSVVKYVGVVVGAELGITLARWISASRSTGA